MASRLEKRYRHRAELDDNYNLERRHSTIACLSPIDYEQEFIDRCKLDSLIKGLLPDAPCLSVQTALFQRKACYEPLYLFTNSPTQ